MSSAKQAGTYGFSTLKTPRSRSRSGFRQLNRITALTLASESMPILHPDRIALEAIPQAIADDGLDLGGRGVGHTVFQFGQRRAQRGRNPAIPRQHLPDLLQARHPGDETNQPPFGRGIEREGRSVRPASPKYAQPEISRR